MRSDHSALTWRLEFCSGEPSRSRSGSAPLPCFRSLWREGGTRPERTGISSKATGAPARFAPRYCFADIVAVDSDIITLLGPDGAAAVLHGSIRDGLDRGR